MLPSNRAEFERFFAKKIRFAIQSQLEANRSVFKDAAEVEFMMDDCSRKMVARLEVMLAGDDKREVPRRTVSHPLTWWDHFKLERFPQWLLSRFPARMKHHEIECTVNITRVCPHIAVPRDNRALYLHWAFIKDIVHDRDEEAKRS